MTFFWNSKDYLLKESVIKFNNILTKKTNQELVKPKNYFIFDKRKFKLTTKIFYTMVKEIDFTIDQEDLQILYLHIRYSYKRMSFDKWVIEVKNVYKEYHDRNLNNLEKYGTPITFSQWVNGQIIGLTLIL